MLSFEVEDGRKNIDKYDSQRRSILDQIRELIR